MFKRFVSEVAQTKWRIQKLRTDNGRNMSIRSSYEKSTKLFRVYDPSRREVEIVRDIKFEEVGPARLVYRNENWEPD
jgi:hypothetical protein